MPPTVTIGMPVRNSEKTLAVAISSLILQTYDAWSLVIVDDGSSDRTAEIADAAAASDSRIQVIRLDSRHGLAAGLDLILDFVSTPFFARMDGDDVAYPQRLERQVGHLDLHPEVDLLGAAMVVFGKGGRAIGKRAAPADHADICRRPQASFRLFHPTWVGRVEWFRRWRYRPSAVRSEDWDLLYRSHGGSQFANLTEPLLGYREDKLPLRKMLLGRATIVRHAGGDMWRHRRLAPAMVTGGEHFLKGIADTIAVASGLDHKLLRHRAGPISADELAEWEGVWASVTAFSETARYQIASRPTS